MNKCYYRIVWKNYPSDKTPLNEQNLNKIDVATDEIDNRIILLDSTKFDKVEAGQLVKYIAYDEDTGIFTINHYNGASYTIDTLLEKLAINFDYDYQTQQLIIELSDGEIKYVDLSSLITQYEFVGSETIAYTVYPDGRVTSAIKEGSIEEKHLRPDYLADIILEQEKAKSSAISATESAIKSKSYAVGGTGTREDEEKDNAKEYARQAKESAEKATEIVGGQFIPISEKGAVDGVATLDLIGKVPESQLPDSIVTIDGVNAIVSSAINPVITDVTRLGASVEILNDNKQNILTGAATTIASNDLTASRALVSDTNGKVAVSDTTSTELGYVHGVTSAIQTQLNNRMPNTMANSTVTHADGLTLNGSCPAFKMGNIVHLNICVNFKSDSKKSNETIIQIPSGWRPFYSITNVASIVYYNKEIKVVGININTNGNVSSVSAIDMGTLLFINITYFSA